MLRLQRRADDLQMRSRHRHWAADALVAEGHHDRAYRTRRSAYFLAKKERETRKRIRRRHPNIRQ